MARLLMNSSTKLASVIIATGSRRGTSSRPGRDSFSCTSSGKEPTHAARSTGQGVPDRWQATRASSLNRKDLAALVGSAPSRIDRRRPSEQTTCNVTLPEAS
ncbi:hypothetical protein [Planctopirus limnophila]|uniref:hypothetical protein n=1 Tax=Planctopirus limnophila TaxID=120 RepID=UPI0011D166D6|nr:hypothetical protein [Planctopirus limnophila]